MRLFVMSFVIGAFMAIAINSQAGAEDETLPLPINTSDMTASTYRPLKINKADMIHESRVQRAKYVAAQHLAIETLNRWSGVNPGRPMVNAGYMYLAPPRATYRWFGPMQPNYHLPYGYPLP
jgi:hypothetical protein